MKHNILSLVLIVGAVFAGVVSGCTEYTDDIQAPSVSQGSPGGGGSNVLPPDLQKPNDGEFSEERMLVNIGLNVISKNVDEFYLEVRRLKRDVTSRCAKLKAGVSDSSQLVRVQEQWKNAMLAYHKLDAAPIGPLSDSSGDLASNIYSWPFINSCGVDLEVARLHKAKPSQDIAVSKKGLGALEYLLYTDISQTACPNSFLNKDAFEWLKKEESTKQMDRCAFEEKITTDLEERAKILFSHWDVSQKNYSKTLIDGSRYKTLKETINAMTDSLFAIEVIKDTKLGIPLGLIKGCEEPNGLCPLQTEHILSGLALESIEAQVSTFKEVFFGGADSAAKVFGFDDYLIFKGHGRVVEEFSKELRVIDDSLLKAQSSGTLVELVAKTDKQNCEVGSQGLSAQPACQLFVDIRALTNLLKTELLTLLALDKPATFQGDND